jgi:hypothetical protein
MAVYYTSIPIAVSISLLFFLLPSIVYKFSIAINVGEYTQLHFIREVKEKLLRRRQRHHRHRKRLHLHLPHDSKSASQSRLISPSTSSHTHSPPTSPCSSPQLSRRSVATSASLGSSSLQLQPRLHTHHLRHYYRHHRVHQHTPMVSQANSPCGSRVHSPASSRSGSPHSSRTNSPGLELSGSLASHSNSLYGEGTRHLHQPTPQAAATEALRCADTASHLLDPHSTDFGTSHSSTSLVHERSRMDRSISRQRHVASISNASESNRGSTQDIDHRDHRHEVPLRSKPTTTNLPAQRHIHHHKYRHVY